MNSRFFIILVFTILCSLGCPAWAQEQHASALPIPRLGRPMEGSAGPAAHGYASRDTPQRELTPAEIMARCSPAIVIIRVTRQDGSSQGTGFFVSPGGLIATCHHVIENARTIEVSTRTGETTQRVRVVVTQPDADLAILAVSGLDGAQPILPLGDSSTVAVGAHVLAVGHPLGLEYSLSEGLVSALRHTDHKGVDLIQFTAPVSVGCSGCPIIDGSGCAIGVVSLSQSSGQNLNFAVPANYLRDLVVRAGRAQTASK